MSERELQEQQESLWWLSLPPAIWLAHFLAVYATVAIYCAKSSEHQALTTPRLAVLVYTLVALAAALATGFRGLRRHRFGSGSGSGSATAQHGFDTPEARHRFIGFATLLLSGLAVLGIVFVAIPSVFFVTCR